LFILQFLTLKLFKKRYCHYAHNQNQVSVSIAFAENDIVKAGVVHAGCIVGHLDKSVSIIPVDLLGDDLVVASPEIYSDLIRILNNI
jgi:hypothetical protein